MQGLTKLFQLIKKKYKIFTFTNSPKYWENRYAKGGNSGHGSYGIQSQYKADCINKFIDEHDITSVTDFGSGDGNNISLLADIKYHGLDVSQRAIDICQKKFADSTNKSFMLYDRPYSDLGLEKTDLALSLDVLFHLVEDQIFESYVQDLFKASNKYVIIYSSDFDERSSAHVRHRKFTEYIKANIKDWSLIKKEVNKYQTKKDRLSDITQVRIVPDFYYYQKNTQN